MRSIIIMVLLLLLLRRRKKKGPRSYDGPKRSDIIMTKEQQK